MQPRRRAVGWSRGGCSFDHLVGEREQSVWHGQAERLCRLEIDRQFEFGRLLYWKLGRSRALENASDVGASTAIVGDGVAAVPNQPAARDELARVIDRRGRGHSRA